jgi:hypothetical protein
MRESRCESANFFSYQLLVTEDDCCMTRNMRIVTGFCLKLCAMYFISCNKNIDCRKKSPQNVSHTE